MQHSKQQRKSNIQRPEVRSLKIQPRIRENIDRTTIPELRLSGNWLEQLGFHHGRRVLITTMKELLIIRLQPEE